MSPSVDEIAENETNGTAQYYGLIHVDGIHYVSMYTGFRNPTFEQATDGNGQLCRLQFYNKNTPEDETQKALKDAQNAVRVELEEALSLLRRHLGVLT